MNEKYAVFIWGSYAVTAAVLLWNYFSARMERSSLRARMAAACAEESES